MTTILHGRTRLALLWLAVLVALPIWISFEIPGWDVAIYHRAIVALHLGRDPYADAISLQVAAHLAGPIPPGTDPPFSYVYSPLTLPVLRLLGNLPLPVVALTYWLLYAAAVLVQLWIALQTATSSERRWLLFLAPLAPFFPGLLANGILLSGNVAYLLYAAIFLTALQALRNQKPGNTPNPRWLVFYAAVLLASCVKAPLLCLVVLAPLTARRQWRPAVLTAAFGSALFAGQILLWPNLFRHYLQAVDLQFRFNHDFGCSPAGLASALLDAHHIPYNPAGLLVYLAYAIPILGLLIVLSRRFLAGAFTLRQWLPVLLVGVILLNPRLIEYDVAPLALPLALIAWRSLAPWIGYATPTTHIRLRLQLRTRLRILAMVLYALCNAVALYSWSLRKLLDGVLLVALFLIGAWRLARIPYAPEPHTEETCALHAEEHRLVPAA